MSDLFDQDKPLFKIGNRKIRFISLFSGIGMQEIGMKKFGIPFEYYKAVELDKYAVKSYNAIHGTNIEVTDIKTVKGEDLGITDKDKYCYVMSYSYPCVDISGAGAQKGFTKGSGTRSGLLWEVERLLNETKEFPDVLIMENVAAVHSKKFINDFNKWIDCLSELGYSSYWQDMNALDYGVAQSRNRCFMVSILGDYRYEFPKPIPLTKCLEDYLIPEEEVEDKYYFNSVKTERLIQDMKDKGELPYAKDSVSN